MEPKTRLADIRETLRYAARHVSRRTRAGREAYETWDDSAWDGLADELRKAARGVRQTEKALRLAVGVLWQYARQEDEEAISALRALGVRV